MAPLGSMKQSTRGTGLGESLWSMGEEKRQTVGQPTLLSVKFGHIALVFTI